MGGFLRGFTGVLAVGVFVVGFFFCDVRAVWWLVLRSWEAIVACLGVGFGVFKCELLDALDPIDFVAGDPVVSVTFSQKGLFYHHIQSTISR